MKHSLGTGPPSFYVGRRGQDRASLRADGRRCWGGVCAPGFDSGRRSVAWAGPARRSRADQRGRLRQPRNRQPRVRRALQRDQRADRRQRLRPGARQRDHEHRVPARAAHRQLPGAESVPRRHGSARSAASGRDRVPLSGRGEPDPERRPGRDRTRRHRDSDARGRSVLRGLDHRGGDRRLPGAGQPGRGRADASRGFDGL